MCQWFQFPPRCDALQHSSLLLELVKCMLDHDPSAMVLTSAIIAFLELAPQQLDLLHTSFRTICHILTDMDEWGQVVVVDTLARYCRRFFCAPKRTGSAETIDRHRRVRRTLEGIRATASIDSTGSSSPNNMKKATATSTS